MSDSVEDHTPFHYDIPTTMKKSLDDIRARIDAIDGRLVKLLNQRAKLGQAIAEVKKRDGRPVYHPARENEILERVVGLNDGPLPDGPLTNIFREIFSATRAVERELKVASLGVAGSYSHLAALKLFGHSAVHLHEASFDDVFAAVEKGQADYAVVPVENSIEGPIGQTLDLLATSPLTVYAEHCYPIRLTVMAKADDLSKVKTLYTHYMPRAQSRRWLGAHLSGVKVVETPSSSEAAARAAKDPDGAAIGSAEAAALYGLSTLVEGIEENPGNQTRFFVMSRTAPPKGKRNKTSLVLSANDEAGALFSILRPFAQGGINLSKIISRPDRSGRWEYRFFIDIDGDADDPKVAACLKKVARSAKSLKIVGAYPAADGV
ncbi:MAG: prephenate dehydratase [Nitrospinae bacterium]|nr:prephenate dehydratase [Nitrospinota bacterium]